MMKGKGGLDRTHRSNVSKSVRTEIATNVKYGLWMAAAATILVAVRWAVLGRGDSNTLVLLAAIVIWYFSAAIVGGAIFGALGQHRTNGLSSASVGAAAALIPFCALAAAFYGFGDRYRPTLGQAAGAAVMSSVLFGGTYGLARWTVDKNDPDAE